MQAALHAKQPTITDGSLTIARTTGLQAALDAKQPTIIDGSLTIARTTGLQAALDAKQATIIDGSLTIARTTGLQAALDAKQATITDASLTIARTTGLQAALDSRYTKTEADTLLATKQATITDASLTIARTNGLQAALDAKLATSGSIPIAQVTSLTTSLAAKAPLTAINNDVNYSTTISGQMTTINSRLTSLETSGGGAGSLTAYASDYEAFWAGVLPGNQYLKNGVATTLTDSWQQIYEFISALLSVSSFLTSSLPAAVNTKNDRQLK